MSDPTMTTPSQPAKAAAPTPETDAEFLRLVKQELQELDAGNEFDILRALRRFARTLERQRDEARAERDKVHETIKLACDSAGMDPNDFWYNLPVVITPIVVERDTAIASLATAQKERDEATAALLCFDDDGVTRITWEALAEKKAQRVARLETALRRLIQQCDDTDWMGVAGEMDAALDDARNALSDPAPSGAPSDSFDEACATVAAEMGIGSDGIDRGEEENVRRKLQTISQTQPHAFPASERPHATCPHCGAPGDTETAGCFEFLEQVAQRQAGRPE